MEFPKDNDDAALEPVEMDLSKSQTRTPATDEMKMSVKTIDLDASDSDMPFEKAYVPAKQEPTIPLELLQFVDRLYEQIVNQVLRDEEKEERLRLEQEQLAAKLRAEELRRQQIAEEEALARRMLEEQELARRLQMEQEEGEMKQANRVSDLGKQASANVSSCDADMDDIDERSGMGGQSSVEKSFEANTTDDVDQNLTAEIEMRKSMLDLIGIDQVAFFRRCIAYLENIVNNNQKRITQKNATIISEINEMLDLQIGLYKDLTTDVEGGTDVIKNLDTNTLEHILKGLVPVVSISESKFLFGT